MAKNKIKHPKILVKKVWNGERTTHHLANGRLHRLDGPAVILKLNRQVEEEYHEWWRNGKKHRIDGPAQYNYFPKSDLDTNSWVNETYYHRGRLMTESEFYSDERKGQRRGGMLASLLNW